MRWFTVKFLIPYWRTEVLLYKGQVGVKANEYVGEVSNSQGAVCYGQ